MSIPEHYSQGDEERAILEFFGNSPDGMFLDIGAWNGVTFSNTRRLVEMGWGGVLVEPSANAFRDLLWSCKEHPRVTCVCVAVTLYGGWVEFWQTDDALSTTDLEHRDKWVRGFNVDFRPSILFAVTPAQLLNRFPGPYDFLKIDVEGKLNRDLTLEFISMNAASARLLCVEIDGPFEAEVTSRAGDIGFRPVHRTADNLLLGR
jgi:FkbM family methyltransferase